MKRPYCMMLALTLAASWPPAAGRTGTPRPRPPRRKRPPRRDRPAEETPAVAGDFYTLTNGPFNTGDACYVLTPIQDTVW